MSSEGSTYLIVGPAAKGKAVMEKVLRTSNSAIIGLVQLYRVRFSVIYMLAYQAPFLPKKCV